MLTRVVSLLILLSATSSVFAAQTTKDDFNYVLDVVKHLKVIIHQQKDEASSRKTLDSIVNAKPLLKDQHYRGHQLIHGREIKGFIGINYEKNKASVAVFSTTPLRVRHATRGYKAYRKLLQQEYKEIKHNHYDLGNEITARLKKKARKITIDVYRNK